MDSAYQLFKIKNIVVLSSEKAKQFFLKDIYPYNIDCTVYTQKEARSLTGNFKVVFIGCYLDNLSNCENIILDDFIEQSFKLKTPFKIAWTRESLASFIGLWFNQEKIRKLGNNLTYFYNKDNTRGEEWLKTLMSQ